MGRLGGTRLVVASVRLNMARGTDVALLLSHIIYQVFSVQYKPVFADSGLPENRINHCLFRIPTSGYMYIHSIYSVLVHVHVKHYICQQLSLLNPKSGEF